MMQKETVNGFHNKTAESQHFMPPPQPPSFLQNCEEETDDDKK